MCGNDLPVGKVVRYDVRIEIKVAFDPAEFENIDPTTDFEGEIRRLLRPARTTLNEESQCRR